MAAVHSTTSDEFRTTKPKLIKHELAAFRDPKDPRAVDVRGNVVTPADQEFDAAILRISRYPPNRGYPFVGFRLVLEIDGNGG